MRSLWHVTQYCLTSAVAFDESMPAGDVTAPGVEVGTVVCGPAALLEAARDAVGAADWPDTNATNVKATHPATSSLVITLSPACFREPQDFRPKTLLMLLNPLTFSGDSPRLRVLRPASPDV